MVPGKSSFIILRYEIILNYPLIRVNSVVGNFMLHVYIERMGNNFPHISSSHHHSKLERMMCETLPDSNCLPLNSSGGHAAFKCLHPC